MRYRQVVIILTVLFVILLLWLFYIQIIQGNYFYDLSRKNSIRVVPLEAARGRILDRNGIALADTRPSFDISLIPQEIQSDNSIFEKLSRLLNVPFEKIRSNYKKGYVNSFTPAKVYEKLDKEKIVAIEENKFQLRGVIVDIQPQRFYPFGRVASNILGYLGQIDTSRITRLKPYGYESTDLVGYSGIEEYYDLFLRGEEGGEQIEVDNHGQRVRTVGYKPSRQGRDIQITIDIRAQKIIDNFMKDYRGSAIIMDPYNGEIIAMASYPNYDPNDFAKSKKETIKNLFQDEHSPLFNRAISANFPPGSVFKIITATAALEEKPSFINKSFTCNGYMQIGNRYYDCNAIHGQESFMDAIVHSCNVYFYNLGMRIGPEVINKYAYLLGLGRKTGIDLNYEAAGFIPSPNWKKIRWLENWHKGDTANMAIGQGEVLATPLQLVRMMAVFANGGELVHPHLLKAVGDRQVITKNKIVKLNKDTLNNINNGLYAVADSPEGTAYEAKIQGLRVYGKTGTAEVSAGRSPHGWCVGYVGQDKPKYAFCVFLENCGSSHIAVRLAREILEKLLKEGLIEARHY
jgi:penicillin-binding protein 2